MKKFLQIILIIVAITANSVFAATYNDTYIINEIKKQIIQQNKKYTDAQIEVVISNMPFNSMTIPDGKVKFVVKSNFDKFVPRDIKKVYIYSNGRLEREFLISVRTLAYKNVLCAKTQINRDALLSIKENVVPKRMEISLQLENVLTEDMILNKQVISKKWFREGEIIDKRFVKIKPDVERNSQVQVYVKSNGVMLTITGTAITEGMVGEYVTVNNPIYKKTYKARVIGENKVLVNI